MNFSVDKNNKYLDEIRSKFNFGLIEDHLKKISGLKVFVIGDVIIDQYTFVQPKGKAIKDSIISTEYLREEVYAGGILAIVNHLNTFVDKIKLVTLIGDRESYSDFIANSIGKNIDLKTFVKENSPTTIKKRFIDSYKNSKLFKIEHINENPISKDLSDEIVSYLEKEIKEYDLVVVGDFGHGFINQAIRDVLEKESKFLAINVQSNSSNMGFNYFNLYKRADYLTMNEEEIRMPLMRRFEEVDEIIPEVQEKYGHKTFLVTKGKKGSIFYNDHKINSAPILINTVVDTVGAGDALFAISLLFVYSGIDDVLVPLLANSAGGIKSNYIGNKESVTKERLLAFLKDLKIKWPGYKSKMKNALDIFEFDEKILDILRNSMANKQKIFIGGNGGSASIASHYACDFSKGATKNWSSNFRRYKVISLTNNISYITAISNDEQYEDVFRQQLINLAEPNDILIMISASGNSPNAIKAVQWAKENGMITISVTGFSGGKLKEIADYSAHINWPEYEICEDVHTVFGHFLATYLRDFEESTDTISKKDFDKKRLF